MCSFSDSFSCDLEPKHFKEKMRGKANKQTIKQTQLFKVHLLFFFGTFLAFEVQMAMLRCILSSMHGSRSL